MLKLEANRYHDFSCGHRVFGHEGVCAHLHGHNYRVTFHITSNELDSVGRVLDFSVIKSVLCVWIEDNWDHKFLIWDNDPLADGLLSLDSNGVVKVPFNPTAENMAQYLLEQVGPLQLPDYVLLYKVDLMETRKCGVTVEK